MRLSCIRRCSIGISHVIILLDLGPGPGSANLRFGRCLSFSQDIFDIFALSLDAVVKLFQSVSQFESHVGLETYPVFLHSFIPTPDKGRVIPNFFLRQCPIGILILPHDIRNYRLGTCMVGFLDAGERLKR